jgi:SAM-dependent methyltransferase
VRVAASNGTAPPRWRGTRGQGSLRTRIDLSLDASSPRSPMHPSALRNADRFFRTYAPYMKSPSTRLADIGSQDVNGSIREVCPPGIEYVGVDFVAGKGVDVVLDDPYVLPFEAESFDFVVTSSCFEHSEMFWLLFLELLRIVKPEGLIYLNAPSNAAFHRYPVDCWRFYPDSGHALVNWGRRSGYRCGLLESYISDQGKDGMINDFVAVTIKDAALAAQYPDRITRNHADYSNGFNDLDPGILRHEPDTEDHRKLLRSRLKTLRRQAKSGLKKMFSR